MVVLLVVTASPCTHATTRTLRACRKRVPTHPVVFPVVFRKDHFRSTAWWCRIPLLATLPKLWNHPSGSVRDICALRVWLQSPTDRSWGTSP